MGGLLGMVAGCHAEKGVTVTGTSNDDLQHDYRL